MVLLPRFHAGQVLSTLDRTAATALPGLPSMYQALLDDPKVGATDFAHLRVCVSGGAPLPAELKAKFEATAGARLVEGYGLSESSGVVSCNPYEGDGKSGTIGQPIPGTRVRLVDKDDTLRPPPDRQRLVKGKGVDGRVGPS